MWEELSKREQLKLKVWFCMLGLGLLFLLLGVRALTVLLEFGEKEKVPESVPEHIPVIEVLANVWIMDADDEKVQIFRDGVEEILYYAPKLEGNTVLPEKISSGNLSQVTKQLETMEAEDLKEQIADIELTDGLITALQVKRDRIHGKVLSAGPDVLELEGYGRLPLASDYKGYRIYNTLVMCVAEDLPFGYDFADFCVENGEICGILMAQEAAMEYIRVLVKTSDYGETLHGEIVLTADCDFAVVYGTADAQQTEQFPAGTELTLREDSSYLAGDRVRVVPSLLTGKLYLNNVRRNSENPGYRGTFELQRTDGGIAVVNELLLEEYLYSVVPSEMPASYPAEALQAQAVCARTYAYGHMLHAAYPEYGAHVDDSTSYQVYNNIAEQESTTTAVKETYGQLLITAENQPAQTYYYSTSCGVGTDAGVWSGDSKAEIPYLKGKGHNFETARQGMLEETEISETPAAQETDLNFGDLLRLESAFAEFITGHNSDDFEANEPWYRWEYQVEKIDRAQMLKRLQGRYKANQQLVLTLDDGEFVSVPIKELDRIEEIYISGRGSGGVASELVIETKKNTYKVLTEYNIRYVLCSGEDMVVRRDGTEVSSLTLLPSGFLLLEMEKEGGKEDGKVVGYKVIGGGFGHGAGMSQNGAKNMAAAGYTAEDILGFYYEGCIVQSIY